MVAQSFSDLASGITKVFSGNSIAVGVDVGTKSVKAVVLEKENGKIVLKNYSIARVKKPLIELGQTGVINDFSGGVVKGALEGAGIKRKKVNVAIPSFTSLIITIEIPHISDKEFEQAVRREVSKYIPVKIDDVVYDWQIIDEASLRDDNTADNKHLSSGSAQSRPMVKILVIAVMKEISGKYNQIFSANDLEINLLEIDSISLTRSLTRGKEGVYLILDIGHETSNIVVSSQDGILMNRTISIGGDKMTQVIADSMKVSFERAEQIKKTHGVNVSVSGQQGGVLSTVLSMLTDEMKKTVELFQADFKGIEVKGVLLAGGSATMIGLRDLIQAQTGLETFIGNALEGITFNAEIKNVLLKHASLLSIAIGLALANFEE